MAILGVMGFIVLSMVMNLNMLNRNLAWTKNINTQANKIQSKYFAEAGLNIAFVNNLTTLTQQRNNCTLTVSRFDGGIESVATCGEARSKISGFYDTTPGSGVPAHCTNGHGHDAAHNKHCLSLGRDFLWTKTSL